jgi:hypothetical protein
MLLIELYPLFLLSANACASTQVDNSDYATYNSLSGFVGATFTVTCNQGYEGSGVAICLPDGAFDVPSCTLIPNFVQVCANNLFVVIFTTPMMF